MCGLCGIFESGRRWLDATTTLDPTRMRRERLRRVALVGEVLRTARIAVDDWQGASFLLRGPTGKTEIVDNLFDLWRKAQALGCTTLDPLAQHGSRSPVDPGAWQAASFSQPVIAPAASDTRSAADSAPEPAMHRIPVHVLTGFLGSGKTTLLNRMLRDPALSDSAVLINEIGSIAIDHHLVERMVPGDALDIVILKGGCACCAVRGDMVVALHELYVRRATGTIPRFRRVVLETSGLAEPAPLLFTLAADSVLRHKFEAGVVLATADAMHGAAQCERHPEWQKQIAVADRLVVTKTDLCAAPQAAQLIALLAHLNPAAEICNGVGLGDAGSLLAPVSPLSAPTRETRTARKLGHLRQAGGHAGRHTPDVDSAAFVLDASLEWSALAVWLTRLLHAHGDRMLRFKGLLGIQGSPAPVALDGVHHLIHAPRHLAAWPPGPRISRLVFIAQGLQVDLIEPSLRSWLITAGWGVGAGVPDTAADRRG